MAEILNLLTYLDYKKNPKGLGIILTFISIILLAFSTYKLINEYQFIGNTESAQSTTIDYNCMGRDSCILNIYFQTKTGKSYNITTTKRYSQGSHDIRYLKNNPNVIIVDQFPVEFIVLFMILSVVSFIFSRILLKEGNKDDIMEEKLKKVGKYFKTKFIRVEEKKEQISEFYTEYKTNAMGRRRAITKRQVLNVKKYWIHTELKVKGKDEILEFKSREIRGYDPREDIQNLIASGEKIGVWVNPKNPEEYAVDVSFLKY